MSNYAYLSLWFEDASPASLINQAEKLLSLFPLSATEPGFRAFVIRAVSPAEPPVYEREVAVSAAMIGAALQEFFRSDCAAELCAYWDWWTYCRDGPRLSWEERPLPVEFLFQGEEYDDGVAAEAGHAVLTLGFEHLLTGHAGILRGSQAESDPEQFTARPEYEFALALQEPETLEAYRTHTLENIRRLLAFERALWTGLRIRQRRLWSEGEANLERSLDQILLHTSRQ